MVLAVVGQTVPLPAPVPLGPLVGMRRAVKLCPRGLEKCWQKGLYTPLGSCHEASVGNARDGDNRGHQLVSDLCFVFSPAYLYSS